MFGADETKPDARARPISLKPEAQASGSLPSDPEAPPGDPAGDDEAVEELTPPSLEWEAQRRGTLVIGGSLVSNASSPLDMGCWGILDLSGSTLDLSGG